MGWRQVLGLSISALVLALLAYGLLFAEPRWIEIKIEPAGGVTL